MRLADVEVMGLDAETVEVPNREARRETLERHGALAAEIEFLAPKEGDCRRVELNAMTSRQLVDFVELRLREHGVAKVVPDGGVLLEHARHHFETRISGELLAQHAEDIATRAAAHELPPDLATRVAELLEKEPELSWDQALAKLVQGTSQ